MRTGPRPTPTHLKLLRGDTGHRPIKRNEPQPTPPDGLPEPPEFLDEYARAEWERLRIEMVRLKLLTTIDIHPLAAYCQAYSRWRLAEETLRQMARRDPVLHALMLRAKNGSPMHNPLVITAMKAANEMVRFAAEFGLTPSARARLATGLHDDGGQGKFTGLLA